MKYKIKEIRKKKYLNQKEFGEKIGVEQATISAWEKGIRNPSETALLQICSTFHVRMEYLKKGIEPIFEEDEEVKLEKIENAYKGLFRELSELPAEDIENIIQYIRTEIKGRYPDE